MAEHGKFPSVIETSYEVPHHMGLQQQGGDKKVDLGPSPSTMVTSMNLLNNMKTTPTFDSYSESSYETAHETLSLVSEESGDFSHPTTFIFGGVMERRLSMGLSLQPRRRWELSMETFPATSLRHPHMTRCPNSHLRRATTP